MKVGEHKLLGSQASGIEYAHVFHCPWQSRFKGASSNVAFAAKVGGHVIEIVNQQVLVDQTQVTSAQTYPDGTTVKPLGSDKGWLIQAPPSVNGRAEIKLKRRTFQTNQMPSGYIYDIFAKIPEAYAADASGLCDSPSAGELPNECDGNSNYPTSKFSSSTLASLDEMCFVESGVKKCEFDSDACSDGASCCTLNGHSLATAKTVCADVAGCDQYDNCLMDYCITGEESFAAHSVDNCGDTFYPPTPPPTSEPTSEPTGAPSAGPVAPYACERNTPPLQMIQKIVGGTKYREWDIKSLDIQTGEYDLVYTVPATEIKKLNGASISPIDSKVPV